MATKNSRNARLLLSLNGTTNWTIINKTHGLKISLPPDFNEDTGHGAKFKSYTLGLFDFAMAVTQYYDNAVQLLEAAAINGTTYYFLAYFDYPNDPANYWRGQVFVGFSESNMDIGQTIDQSFDFRIANADVALVRNGTTYS